MERADVKVSRGPGRCAYCHDDVPEAERTACIACLAVHHHDCWHGRCAACGEARSLTPERAGETPLERPAAEIPRGLVAVFLVTILIGGALAVSGGLDDPRAIVLAALAVLATCVVLGWRLGKRPPPRDPKAPPD